MPLAVAYLVATMAMSGVTIQREPDGPREILSRLEHLRVAGAAPKAVLISTTGEESYSAISFYEDRPPEPTGSTWIIRLEFNADDGSKVVTVRGEDCPAIFDTVLAIERLSLPPIDMRSAGSGSPVGYRPSPPALGPSHTSYALWGRGWATDGSPFEATFSSLGAGPLAEVFMAAEDTLRACGADTRSPQLS